jgi:RHS repeat-associated protein
VRQQALGVAGEEPLSWGVAGGFRPEFVPKDPAGNRTAEQIDDAVTDATYNNMNQLVSQQAGGALVFKGTVSEPASVTLGGKPAAVTADNRFEGQALVPGGTGQVAVTATDPSGNLRTNTYEVSQAATSKSFTYDANGNMTSDGTRTYEWDAENRLVTVKEGANTIASYAYNAGGFRTSKTVGGATTTYLLEDARVVEERSGAGGATKHFYGPGIDDVLGMQDGSGAVSFLTRDHLGSVRELVSLAGAVVLRRDYDPWGNLILGASTSGWAFTGRENEPETGLFYYRARYYDARTARFASEDPLAAGRGGHLYAYAGNRPLAYIDPWGLKETCALAPKMKECLEKIFKEDVSKVEVVHEPKKNPKYSATTRRNKIILWDYTCSEFWAAHNAVLEEYYHVLRQWNTGRLSKLKYAWEYIRHGYDDNKYEKEAKAFADEHTKELDECCKEAKP